MLVMSTARRLKPGAWDQFRRAWDPGDDKPPGFQRAYHARNIRDEDEVISFGLFDMSEDDYRAWRERADADENQRVDRRSAFVENENVAGVYEGVDAGEEKKPRRARDPTSRRPGTRTRRGCTSGSSLRSRSRRRSTRRRWSTQ